MKKFLKRISFFILPVILIMYPADYIISKYLWESQDFTAGELIVWKDIYKGNINSDLVIYGSSRAWLHINPRIIEDSLQISAYNLGIDGHNFWMQYFRHKELLKLNKKPRQIIMSVDAFTLQKRSDLYNYPQFLPFLLWNKNAKQYTSSYIGFTTYDYYIPLIRYSHERASLIAAYNSFRNNKTIPARIKGYKGMEKSWNDDLDKAKSTLSYYEIKLDSSTIKLFEQFIQECRRDNISLTLIYTPEHIEGQAFIKNRKEIVSKYHYFADKYNLRFIDYSNDTLCYKKEYFYNSEHLNKRGSEIFTNKLVKDIQAQSNLIKEVKILSSNK